MCLDMFPLIDRNEYQGATVFLLVLFVAERLTIAISTSSLIKKSNLNLKTWTIMALILGFNQLLLLNIAIWMKPKRDIEI